jgi:Glycosyl hydrolases family 25
VVDLFFPDVSEFQDNVDGPTLIGGGFPVIIARVHNGNRPDLMMPARRDYLRTCGFVAIGWYQYLVQNRDPATQAQEFLSTLGPLEQNEFCVLDLEEGQGDQTGRAESWFAVVDPTGPKAWLYSGASFLGEQLSGTGHWSDRPLWIASYESGEPGGASTWQYTNGSYVSVGYGPIDFPGIGFCDASVFHGDVTTFIEMAGVPGPAPPKQGGNMLITQDNGPGYWMLDEIGGVFAKGGAPFCQSLPGLGVMPSAPIIGGASTPSGQGYWLAGADASVYALGDAQYLGPDPTWRAQWGIGTTDNPCVGIAGCVIDGQSSYALGACRVGEDPDDYAMTPDGRYAQPT